MAFVSDSFTDTDNTTLQSHTGETGATWTEHANESGNDAKIISNQCKHDSSAGVAYYASGTPASAEYDVQATCGAASTATYGPGIFGRLSTSALTGYLAWSTQTTTTLYKVSAGSYTDIGNTSYSWAASDVVKLQIRDAAKKIFVNGVEKVSSTDNTITAAGKAGLRFYGNGGILDDFSATDAGGGDVTIALTGAGITSAAGSLGVGSSIGMSGSAITSSAGTLSPTVSALLAGSSITVSAGTVLADTAKALTGSAATFSSGTLDVSASIALSGSYATFTAGSVGVQLGNDVTVALSGAAITASAGSLVPGASVAMSGAGSTISAGSLLPEYSRALTGSAATFAAGSVLPSAGIGLTGSELNAFAGSLGVDYSISLSGSSMTASAGTLVVGTGSALYNTVYKTAEFSVAINKSAEFTVSATNRTLRF